MADSELDGIADALYALPPEDFVPARDDQVGAARERGDRDLARAIGHLRRPTRPAWLANLLTRHRAEQLDGLITLAAGLAQAQRTLDGAQLRELSAQRNRAVAAMAREAGRLAQQAGSPATDAQLRELKGILDAALAQPDVARELRTGRLTRTLTYTGFGPETDAGAIPVPAPRAAPEPDTGSAAIDTQRRDADLRTRREALADAEQEAQATEEQQQRDEATHREARDRHAAARERIATLTAELAAAQDEERRTAAAEQAATAALRHSSRAARAAATDLHRARARLAELG